MSTPVGPGTAPEVAASATRPKRRSVRDAQRAEVVLRYARLLRSGRPMYCKPSRAEIAGEVPRRQGRGTDGKIIYPDRASAESAARELEALGSRPMRSYLCRRSEHGHHHLTTDATVGPPLGLPAHRRPAD